jgi:GNAT superfamily N-acetyltransferase
MTARLPLYSAAMVDVRKATRDDIEACARVLAMAFQDDPGTRNFEPDDEHRRRILPPFFRSFVAAALDEEGDILVAGEPIEGVASWFGPDRHGPSPEAMGANGFGDVVALARPESAERLIAMVGEIERQHELLTSGPHFRLEFYGVVPERQGTGLGSLLIDYGHARADRLGLPTYLETMSERNVSFYQRRRYAVVGEFTVGRSTRAWGMVRQPQRS